MTEAESSQVPEAAIEVAAEVLYDHRYPGHVYRFQPDSVKEAYYEIAQSVLQAVLPAIHAAMTGMSPWYDGCEKVSTSGECCDRCGESNDVPWWASFKLWVRVNGAERGVLCPRCFTFLAGTMGIPVTWTVAMPGESEPSEFERAEAEYQARRVAEERRDALQIAVAEREAEIEQLQAVVRQLQASARVAAKEDAER